MIRFYTFSKVFFSISYACPFHFLPVQHSCRQVGRRVSAAMDWQKNDWQLTQVLTSLKTAQLLAFLLYFVNMIDLIVWECVYIYDENYTHHHNDKNEWIQNLNNEYKESTSVLEAYENYEREKSQPVQLGKFESTTPASSNAGCVQDWHSCLAILRRVDGREIAPPLPVLADLSILCCFKVADGLLWDERRPGPDDLSKPSFLGFSKCLLFEIEHQNGMALWCHREQGGSALLSPPHSISGPPTPLQESFPDAPSQSGSSPNTLFLSSSEFICKALISDVFLHSSISLFNVSVDHWMGKFAMTDSLS